MQPPGEVTYLLAPLTVQELLHLHEPKDGVLDPVEEGAFPADGACHGRVVLVQRRVVLVLHEDLINDINLESKGVSLSPCVPCQPGGEEAGGGCGVRIWFARGTCYS